MRLVSLDHAPPGGFRVRFEPTGWSRANASSFWDLALELADHARANGHELPEAEAARMVESQTAEHLAARGHLDRIVQHGGHLPLEAYLHGAAVWAAAQGADDRLAPLEEAEARAATCRRCPFNVEPEHEGPLERWARRRMRSLVGERVERFADLHTCAACGCELPTLVNVSADLLAGDPVDPESLPAACWRRSALP